MLLFLTTFLAGVHVFGIGAASCLYSLRGPEQLLDLVITCYKKDIQAMAYVASFTG